MRVLDKLVYFITKEIKRSKHGHLHQRSKSRNIIGESNAGASLERIPLPARLLSPLCSLEPPEEDFLTTFLLSVHFPYWNCLKRWYCTWWQEVFVLLDHVENLQTIHNIVLKVSSNMIIWSKTVMQTSLVSPAFSLVVSESVDQVK